jgi:hypothetical protein
VASCIICLPPTTCRTHGQGEASPAAAGKEDQAPPPPMKMEEEAPPPPVKTEEAILPLPVPSPTLRDAWCLSLVPFPHHIAEDHHLRCRSRQQRNVPTLIVAQHRPNVGVAPPPSSSVPPSSMPTFQPPPHATICAPFQPRDHTHDPQVLCLPSMLPNKLCMSHPSSAPPFHPRRCRPRGKGRSQGAAALPWWTQDQGQSYIGPYARTLLRRTGNHRLRPTYIAIRRHRRSVPPPPTSRCEPLLDSEPPLPPHWESAQEACRDSLGRAGPAQAATGLATNVPFSSASKRVFEVVVEFLRTRNIGCNFILPEHIALGIFDLDVPTTSRILKRLVVIFYYILCYFPSCFVNGI